MGDRVGATLSGSLEGVLRRWRALAGGTQAVLASLTVLSLAAAGGVLWVALFSSSGHDDEGALPLDESVTSASPVASATGEASPAVPGTTAGAAAATTATAASSPTTVAFGEGIEVAQSGTGGATILVDESHGQRMTVDPGRANLIDPLNPQWVTLHFPSEMSVHRDVRTSLAALDLAGYDLVVLPCPSASEFEPAEIEAVRDYVTAGGGLLLIGNAGTSLICATNFGGIGEELGVAFDPAPIAISADAPERMQDEFSFVITEITLHDSIAGTAPGGIFANYAGSIEPDASWEVLARTPADVWRDADFDKSQDEGEAAGPFALLAVKELGAGRMAAISDEWLFFDQPVQEPVRERILAWLVDGQSRNAAAATSTPTPAVAPPPTMTPTPAATLQPTPAQTPVPLLVSWTLRSR